MQRINFGPPVFKTKVSEEFRKELLKSALEQKIPYNQNLEGRIENEKGFDKKSQKIFENDIIEIIKEYIKNIVGENKVESVGLILDSLWVNFQKCNEYNPPHIHTADISFIIYLNIPPEIKSEKFNGQSNVNGTINFSYGNSTFPYQQRNNNQIINALQPKTLITHTPETGEMFIFPSYLTHYVESFTTKDVERISVSGNLFVYSNIKTGLI